MSTEDPFFVVKGEVQKALSRARALFERWEELLQDGTQVSRDELDWSANELRNCLRAIDWDLEDLSETISIVESNPGKFRLADDELRERRSFVERTRSAVQEMKDQLSSPSAVAQAEKKNREALLTPSAQDKSTGLEAHLVSANSRYIQEQQEQQQVTTDTHTHTHRFCSKCVCVCVCVCAADRGGAGRAAGVGVGQHQSPQRHVGTHRERAGRAGCHVGRLRGRDGPDDVPHGLSPQEAGEGVPHDQQPEAVVRHRRAGGRDDRGPRPLLCSLTFDLWINAHQAPRCEDGRVSSSSSSFPFH
ncbi:syntaxin-10 isoform X1 [Pseudoliparis swirei]|uniref:syntaxin-10 isoform X1 n=1 Tax=Pseudoliparis swirei TaxID=2059687 RepID=UPI0024BF0B7D|nr:syntaxin-10 isoform X1 [Pseudoliparis swirei]